jgi:F0F1-type ATP synthase membrane subunit b/b'
MENGSSGWVAVALFLSVTSFILALVAYWRSGGRNDLEVIRRKQQLVHDELANRVRTALQESHARATRAQRRLAELRTEAAENVHASIDALSRELETIKHEIEDALAKLKTEASTGTQALEENLAKRVHHIEGSLRILAARAEIRAAERLADAGRFVAAEDLLEDAISKVREAKMQVSDEGADEPAFAPVVDALHDAIRSIRARAADHKRQIDCVLAASDSLLASLRARDHIATA